ncbi:substrate-binding domain-containing protein [Kribbella sandramycini]|uniref:DNA-binding LacI/PurR family transcriptional regulator n=1 Tax=Kribbella sandramycini TaxID=60450 RepID=A0A7Y4L5W7_9ACTN|nr:LacI family DNA-binding transcriptional regulator [Kribbella sandramycini]MBB6565933.1 DNA-binding LacI/PurR family transcriptional regulator [Kribbella sandramycini]NOL44939.1 substrate-binding domain-containing protein [Kribbella sandramycini]
MLAPERHELILRGLRRHGRLRVAELVAELGVSAITVRRDLAELDAAGLLRRVHGGAIGAGPADQSAPGTRLTIGIVVPRASFYYTDVIRGAEAMAARYGARLILGISGYDPVVELERIEKVLGIGVAGLLLSTAYGDGEADRLGSRLDDIDVPVVLMERAFGFPHVAREYDHVRTDHAYGAMLALRHFTQLGHRRIVVSLQPTVTAHWLRRGIEQAAATLGAEVFLSPADLPQTGDDPASLAQLDAFLAECESHNSRAVLIHSDEHAARLVERAMERGLRVPEDLAVVVYNDVTAALAVVPLTAVSPPRHALGETACDLLIRKLQSKPAPTQHLSLLPTLNIRSSCGAQPAALSR